MYTQLAKMSFDEIFDLTAGWSVFSFFIIYRVVTPPTIQQAYITTTLYTYEVHVCIVFCACRFDALFCALFCVFCKNNNSFAHDLFILECERMYHSKAQTDPNNTYYIISY